MRANYPFDKVTIPLGYNLSTVQDAIKVGKRVLMGEKIGYDYLEKKAIFASVSGEVIAIESRVTSTNQTIKHVVIKDDFQSEKFEYSDIELDSIAAIRRRITEFGLDINQKPGLYTDLDFSNEIETIVVDACSEVSGYLLENHTDELTQGLEILRTAAKVDKVLILSKTEYSFNGITSVFVNPKNPLDYYRVLQKNHISLSNDLLSKNTLFIDLERLHDIYLGCVINTPKVCKYIAMIKDQDEVEILKVRIGTQLNQLVSETEDEVIIQLDSLVNGVKVKSNEFAITEFISDIYIRKYHYLREYVCTKCGDCNDICPIGILPQNIMDAEVRMNEERIFELSVGKCIECGLCSAVCPSNINVLEWMRRAKRRIR